MLIFCRDHLAGIDDDQLGEDGTDADRDDRRSVPERRGPACLPRRHGFKHRRRRQRLCPGQPRDPAGKARRPRFIVSASSIRNRARSSACPTSAIPAFPSLGIDLDIRTDLPRYRVWRDGEVMEEPTDIMAHWRDDLGRLRDRLLVLVRGGAARRRHADPPHRARRARADVPHQHCLRGRRAVRRARWWCRCGRSSRRMRSARCRSPRAFLPCTARRCISAIRTRSGSPTSASPTTVTPWRSRPDEIPVFWACGVTPQAVIAAARLPFAITHAPGLMLVTDLKNKQLAVL